MHSLNDIQGSLLAPWGITASSGSKCFETYPEENKKECDWLVSVIDLGAFRRLSILFCVFRLLVEGIEDKFAVFFDEASDSIHKV